MPQFFGGCADGRTINVAPVETSDEFGIRYPYTYKVSHEILIPRSRRFSIPIDAVNLSYDEYRLRYVGYTPQYHYAGTVNVPRNAD
jgi:hypothetical protein